MKTRAIEFSINAIPPVKFLSANARLCWQAQLRYKNILKGMVYYAALEARVDYVSHNRHQWKTMPKARLTYTFIFPQKRNRDRDNLVAAMKCGQDMLVRATLIEADDSDHLFYGDHVVLVDKARAPLTIIHLEEIN